MPRLVVGDRYLIGSGEIPDEFPGIVEEGLAGGGIDWPNLPGIDEALAAIPPENPPHFHDHRPPRRRRCATSTTAAGSTTTVRHRLPPSPRPRPPRGGGALPLGGDSMWDRFRRDEAANSLALVVLGLMLLSVVGAAGLWAEGRGRRGARVQPCPSSP